MRRQGIVAASACAAGLVMTYVVAVLVPAGQWLDDEVFGAVQSLGVGALHQWLPFLARRVLPALLISASLGAAVVALRSARWSEGGMAVAIVVLSVISARLLRVTLPRPDHTYSYPFNTLPSTHVALVVSLVVAIAVLIVRRPNWLDHLLLGCVVLACVGNVVGYAHRPSDVLASVFLVGAVAAGIGLVTPHRPRPGGV